MACLEEFQQSCETGDTPGGPESCVHGYRGTKVKLAAVKQALGGDVSCHSFYNELPGSLVRKTEKLAP